MKKLIIGIFISLCAIFLMSHNVSAFSVNQNVDVIQTIYNPRTSFYNGSTWTPYAFGFQRLTKDSGNFTQMRISKADFTNVDSFKVGDYLILNGFITINNVVEGLPEYSGFIGSNYQNVNCPIIDLQFGAYQDYVDYSDGNYVYWKRSDFQLTCKIVNSNYNLSTNFRLNPDVINTGGTRLNISFNSGIYATPGSDAEKEQAATQDAANNSQNAGDSSTSDSQGATSNLLSVFTGFANVITNASATNCVINAPLNTTFGNQNLNVDLCALSLPPAIGALTSIIAVMVVVPFAISMFNKFIGIMEGFQR